MKIFATCFLAVILAMASILVPTPMASAWEPAAADSQIQAPAVDSGMPTPGSGAWFPDPVFPDPTMGPEYVPGCELDRTEYSTGDTTLKLKLSDYFGEWEPVLIEIIEEDTGNLVLYQRTMERSLTIDIELCAGEYLLRASQNTLYSTMYFSVVGTPAQLHLQGKSVAMGEELEFSVLLGVRLEWDGPSDGGPYTLTRIGMYGDVTRIENITLNRYFDAGAPSGDICTYIVSNGEATSNPVVVDLSGYPPLEFAGNRNTKVIVLKIGDPNMYSAKDKQSALNGTALTKIKAIDPNDLGVIPVMKNNRTMIPISTLVQTMGGAIAWDGAKRLVTIKIRGDILEIPINSQTIYVNNEERIFDTPAQIAHNRTLVPVRQLELLGCEVDWVAKTKSVVICYQGS